MAGQKAQTDKIRRIVRQLDGTGLENLFETAQVDGKDLAASVIAETIWSGALILRHATADRSQRRDSFVAALNRVVSKFGNEEQTAAVTKHLREAALIELGFSEILASVERSEITRLSPGLQLWSVIDRAADECRILYERTFPAPKGKGTPLFHAQAPLVKDNKGNEVPADAIANGLLDFVANTLQMLAYRNDWFQGDRLVLPRRIASTADSTFKAGTHAYFASAWDALLDCSEALRFFGKTLEEVQAAEGDNRRALVFDLDLVPALFFSIARLRQHQIQLEFAMRYLVQTSDYQFGDPETGPVPLPPRGYVSLDELVAVTLLDAEYHYPVEDDSPLAGLSLRQWLRAYAVLKRVHCPDLTAGKYGGEVVQVDCTRLERALLNAGLLRDQAHIFLQAATFGKDKRDLWDAPLLQTSDGEVFFLAPLFATADILAIVVSQLATQRVQIPSKGDAFEAHVVEKFNSAGISAKGFKYVLDEKTYQCDAAVVWDKCLFVIECKNYLLPPETPAEEFHFLASLDDAAEQAKRIASDLKQHPEIIAENFGGDSTFTDVYPVVLNAMPFCYPQHGKGVFFYDASALSRFLESGDLFVSQTITVEGKPRLFDHRVGNLWSGESPSAVDFVRQLHNPVQYVVERGLWSSTQFALALSDHWVLAKPRLERKESSMSEILEASGWSEDGIEKFSAFLEELGDKLSDKKRKL
jgi:hypothetical protein